MPLAPEVAAPKRKATLEALLARVQQNVRGASSARPAAAVAAPPPAQEKVSAFDDRWSTPSKPSAPPPSAAAPPAQEKITAFDDRWSVPQKPTAPAPTVAAKPAPAAIEAKPAPSIAAKPARPLGPAGPATAPSGDRQARLTALLERIQRNGRRS